MFYMSTLDSENLRRAFQRAADWNRDRDIGHVSIAETLLLNTLWRFEVLLERECGIPVGTLPEKPHAMRSALSEAVGPSGSVATSTPPGAVGPAGPVRP